MRDPNYLIIGAQKCGTSWLAANLKQHPDVFMAPKKEVHFFDKADNFEKGMDWYHSQFSGYSGQKAIGEATPNYFWAVASENEMRMSDHMPDIPKRVHERCPDARLILMLRDPVRRAISAYYHHIHGRRISPARRIGEVGGQYGIISMGYYYSQLCEWLKHFRMDQILVLIYEEEISKNKPETLRKVFRFLGVSEEFSPEGLDERHNARVGYLYLRLNYYFPGLTRRFVPRSSVLGRIDFPPIDVSPGEVRELEKLYEDENGRLEKMLGREIRPWRPKE